MRIGSLFSGYGGLDLAVEAAFGATTAWVSDIDPGACKILAHRFPDAPNLGDIAQVKWTPDCPTCGHETVVRRHLETREPFYWCERCETQHDVALRLFAAVLIPEPVDVLCGGFPCQDVSHAGRRAGLMGGTRSGLWHEMARAIRHLRPEWVVIENVRGLLSARGEEPTPEHLAAEATAQAADRLIQWIDARSAAAIQKGRTDDARRLAARRGRAVGCRGRALARAKRHERQLVRAVATVLGTLADLGYDAEWRGLPASEVGAPHGRFRVFIVARLADAPSVGWDEGWPESARLVGRPDAAECGDADGDLTRSQVFAGDWGTWPAAALLPTPLTTDAKASSPGDFRRRDPGLRAVATQLLPTPTVQNAHGNGRNGRGESLLPGVALTLLPTPAVNDMGKAYTPEEWDAWTAKMKATHGNGNGHGKSLEIEAARLMPTPTTAPDTGNGHARNLSAEARRFGDYAPAIERWETLIGRPAPDPTEPTGRGDAHRLSPRFTEWMMGVPDGWIVDVPDLTRNEALKACGNGVVPQQAHAAVTDCLWAFARGDAQAVAS